MEQKQMKKELFALLTIVALILATGYMFGYMAGMKKMAEIQDKVDCEIEYGGKSLGEVPVDCLKWFDLKGLKK
jgi:hypothetical protein